MRVLPVLDLKNGQVVRGVAGRRDEYRPIVSQLTTSCAPLDVAAAFRARFDLDELYVADLEAIEGAPAAVETYCSLTRAGFRLWVDAGLRRASDADVLIENGVQTVIAGLETIDGPDLLARLCERHGDRVVFSLDLKNGVPMADLHAWSTADALSIASHVMDLGVTRMLVLDLARVGIAEGTGTLELCRSIKSQASSVELTAGGGIRNREDLQQLRNVGVDFALVASALHDGRLTREDVTPLAGE